MILNTFFKRFAATAALALCAQGAMAQDAGAPSPLDVTNNTAFGNWIVSCEAVTVSRTACTLIQQLTLAENDELVARFVVVPVEGGEAVMLAQVPAGVWLPGGAVYRFADDETLEQREMTWQRCGDDLCEAAIGLDGAEVALFAEKDQLLFGYSVARDAQPVVVGVDISRFGEGLEAIMATAQPAPAAQPEDAGSEDAAQDTKNAD